MASSTNNNNRPHIQQTPTSLAEDPKMLFDLWSKYEDIAMHFNDLLIKALHYLVCSIDKKSSKQK